MPSDSDSNLIRRDDPRWIVSPLFDLFFFANLLWLLVWIPGFVSTDGSMQIEFWQIYFLTTPHRWITLLLVATDPDRRAGRNGCFLSLLFFFTIVVCGSWLTTGAFTCLAVTDYVWNAWHFASQHTGIYRIYSRKTGGGYRHLESIGLRTFVTYTCLRLAGWTTGWTEKISNGDLIFQVIDLFVLAIPAILISVDLLGGPLKRLGKIVYLMSVIMLYGSLLLAVRERSHYVLPLTLASAVFHSVEYLAIVTFYAQRRRKHGSPALFQKMARHWVLILSAFVVLLGIFSAVFDARFKEFWFGCNLWAAYLHYAYDGMIWKLRKSATAKVLGVQGAS